MLRFQWVLWNVFLVGVVGSALPLAAAEPEPVGEGLGRLQRHIQEREYWATQSAGGLQAPNRRQRLRTYFEPNGIRVFDRRNPLGPPLLGLHFASWGRSAAPVPGPPGEIEHAKQRVEIHRPGLTEWFQNGPAGLEHGFDVWARPEGEGPLVFTLDALHAKARLSGEGVRLYSEAGRVLRYAKLLAWDAVGTPLEVHFEVSAPDRLQLVVDDAGALYPLTIDPLLSEASDAQLESDQTGAELGSSVASAGDVNGDGFGDLIVGAPFYDSGESDEGAAFVFLGSASGVGDGGAASAHAQLESNQTLAQFGSSVASAGDVNGDGYADVIVGAPGYTAGQAAEGAAFVFLGSALGVGDRNAGDADAQLESDQSLAALGAGVSSAGDVNGDGYADVLIGAPGYDAGQSDEGAAFVFLGGAAGVVDGNATSAHAQLESDQIDAGLGASVASAGDVDADGYADLIVGAPGYDAGHAEEGAAFLFLGSVAGVPDGNAGSAHGQLESDQANASLGTSVASAGDVNGDGYADVIVGSPSYDAGEIDEGRAFVFLGSAGGVGDGNFGSAHARLEADQAGAALGRSVSSAGDVNGDGYADVIVGAPGYDSGSSNEGAAFVFLGSATGIAHASAGIAYAQLESDQAGGALGESVATAGDLNGDGYADVVAGAPGFDAGEVEEGAALVFHGAAFGVRDANPSSAGAQLESDQAGGGLGISVASAGDVNGDGFSDVIVGARSYDAGETNEGAAFLFHGSALGVGDGDPLSAAAQLESNQVAAELGFSVASAGDVNGDGFGDVIVGAYRYDSGENNEGAAFVFLGSASGTGSLGVAGAHAQFESDQVLAGLGSSVASAGDVDGDGYGDVIVGAHRYDAGEANEGAAFVFLGSAAGLQSGNPASAHAQLEADQLEADFGWSVASAGDVNGDGYGDVIVGACGYDAGETNEGAAFVFLGSASGVASAGAAAAHAQLESDQAGSELGGSVASAGDVNGDAYSDVIVGAYLHDAGELDEGAAFVFLGSASGIADGDAGSAHARLESDQLSAQLGYSVSSAGDVNGDGYSDVVVGAYRYDSGETDEGAAFVFLGSAAGIANGDASSSHALLEADQDSAQLGVSVASAGDVNGDGFADVIAGARFYDDGQIGEGAALVFYGNAAGRPVVARQLRGDASGVPVQPFGSSASAEAFQVQLTASSPRGRERARLEIEVCPAGAPFLDAICVQQEGSSWVDLGTSGATLVETVTGLIPGTLFHWRARVLYAPLQVTQAGITAPPIPRAGPWRQLEARRAGAGIRILPEPGQLGSLVSVVTLLLALRARRRR